MKENIKVKYERIRKEIAEHMQEKYDRVLPLDEMLPDRWKKAELLGFGEKTSVYENVYVYGHPDVGKDVWIGPLTILDGTGGLKIGDGCDIGCGVMIFTHSTHLHCVSKGKMNIVTKPVKIGNHVYIGSSAVILPGVAIGDHSVIGAGAVVTNDIPAFSVAMGVPARMVGKVIINKKSTRIELGAHEEKLP